MRRLGAITRRNIRIATGKGRGETIRHVWQVATRYRSEMPSLSMLSVGDLASLALNGRMATCPRRHRRKLALAVHFGGKPMREDKTGHFVRFVAILAMLTGCTHGQVQVASDSHSGKWARPDQYGPHVARYEIPVIHPKGEVCVMSLGSEKLRGPRAQPQSCLHIRLTAQNSTDMVPWTLDPRDMKLDFEGSSTSAPARVKTALTGGKLAIPKGSLGELDLYFPLGPRSRPLYVDFLWQIRRGKETITVSTRFDAPNVVKAVAGASTATYPAPCDLQNRQRS